MRAFVRGLDVSSYQGRSIDWTRVAADGIAYVYVKASEGATGADPQCAVHVAGARAAGLLVGAYHFAHAGAIGPQVDNFAAASAMLGHAPGDLPPMLDVERSPSPPNAETTQSLLDTLEVRWGCVPVVYGGSGYLGTLGLDAHCPLMLAAYPAALQHAWPNDATVVPQLAPWGMPRFWQFADGCYDLPGSGLCDSSVFLGTLDDLRAFAAGSRV